MLFRSTGVSVGESEVDTRNTGSVSALLGNDVSVTAPTLSLLSQGEDQLFQTSSAHTGGLFLGVSGSKSLLTLASDTLTAIGDRGSLKVGTLELRADRNQAFDATVTNLAIGALAGSGASMTTSLGGSADVTIGSNTAIEA